jgi:hypothetical protein
MYESEEGNERMMLTDYSSRREIPWQGKDGTELIKKHWLAKKLGLCM